MKTTFFKTVMPVAAFLLAAGGALASKSAPAKETVAEFIGHRKVGQTCVATTVRCQDVNNSIPCMSGSDNLYKLSGTSCPDQLWYLP